MLEESGLRYHIGKGLADMLVAVRKDQSAVTGINGGDVKCSDPLKCCNKTPFIRVGSYTTNNLRFYSI